MSGEKDSDSEDLFDKHIELQNQTNQGIMKKSASGGDNATPSNLQKNARIEVNYSMDTSNMVQSQTNNEISGKVYFMVAYRIILHLILLYCVIGTTYLLLFDVCHKCDKVNDAIITSINSQSPTIEPSSNPSFAPSITPSLSPAIATTMMPSIVPVC